MIWLNILAFITCGIATGICLASNNKTLGFINFCFAIINLMVILSRIK